MLFIKFYHYILVLKIENIILNKLFHNNFIITLYYTFNNICF